MAKKNSKNFQIKSGAKVTPSPVSAAGPKEIPKDELCGVNFRYFQQKHECLSDWQKSELRYLASWMVKQATKKVSQITSVTATCHAHQGKKLALPANVSPDVHLYGLDVTAGARVHGFFTDSTFYLVWLDRRHKIHA